MEWTLNKNEKVYSLIKVTHPKYYEHLKKGAHQSHLGRQKNGLVLGRLACKSRKTEILNKIGI